MTDIKPDVVVTDLPSPAPDNPLEALSWLGETVEEVAEGLRARGIKGQRRESQSCVLARYLQEWWPAARVACGHCWDEGQIYSDWKVPSIIGMFEWQFDEGHFPDLIDSDG